MPTLSDKPLRDRVKPVGTTAGRKPFATREGRHALDAVETLRKGFIELRGRSEPASDLRERLLRFIAALNPEMPQSRHPGIQRLLQSGQHRRREFTSTACAASRFGVANRYGGFLRRTLRALRADSVMLLSCRPYSTSCASPVFTAHPTEAKRRVLLGAQRRIFLTHGQLDSPALNRVPARRGDRNAT